VVAKRVISVYTLALVPGNKSFRKHRISSEKSISTTINSVDNALLVWLATLVALGMVYYFTVGILVHVLRPDYSLIQSPSAGIRVQGSGGGLLIPDPWLLAPDATDVPPGPVPRTTVGELHALIALAVFSVVVAAALVFSSRFGKDTAWRMFQPVSRRIALASLATLIMFVIALVVSHFPKTVIDFDIAGLVEKIFHILWHSWILLTAFHPRSIATHPLWLERISRAG